MWKNTTKKKTLEIDQLTSMAMPTITESLQDLLPAFG